MIEATSVTDVLHNRLTHLLTDLHFVFEDTLTYRAGESQTFTLSLHRNNEVDIGVAEVNIASFVSQIRSSLRQLRESHQRRLYALTINGPISIEQICFLVKSRHRHFMWEVTIQFTG
jgi:hypothetical protein